MVLIRAVPHGVLVVAQATSLIVLDGDHVVVTLEFCTITLGRLGTFRLHVDNARRAVIAQHMEREFLDKELATVARRTVLCQASVASASHLVEGSPKGLGLRCHQREHKQERTHPGHRGEVAERKARLRADHSESQERTARSKSEELSSELSLFLWHPCKRQPVLAAATKVNIVTLAAENWSLLELCWVKQWPSWLLHLRTRPGSFRPSRCDLRADSRA